MTVLAEQIRISLLDKAAPEKRASLPKFFKVRPGEYGDGDQFIGVTVPEQRKLAKAVYEKINLEELSKLLQDQVHEVRLTALFILVYKYQKLKSERNQKELVDFYLSHLDYVNNWDLVDSSCYHMLGHYYYKRDKALFFELVETDHLWRQRIAMISSLYWIKRGDFECALLLAERLIDHPHDLIHKAVGWMLREIGKKDLEVEKSFLKKHYTTMPRTALRYAIEKFDPDIRKDILSGNWQNEAV